MKKYKVKLAIISFILISICSSCSSTKADNEYIDKIFNESTNNITEENTPTLSTHLTSGDLKVGETFTNFSCETNKGNTFEINKSNKPKIVNFWATWCGPCRSEMPDLQKAYEEYKDKVDFIMIDAGETKEEIATFINENNFTFPIGYDENDDLSLKYNIVAIPTTYFLDKDNKIVYLSVGMMDEETIYKYLKQIAQ